MERACSDLKPWPSPLHSRPPIHFLVYYKDIRKFARDKLGLSASNKLLWESTIRLDADLVSYHDKLTTERGEGAVLETQLQDLSDILFQLQHDTTLFDWSALLPHKPVPNVDPIEFFLRLGKRNRKYESIPICHLCRKFHRVEEVQEGDEEERGGQEEGEEEQELRQQGREPALLSPPLPLATAATAAAAAPPLPPPPPSNVFGKLLQCETCRHHFHAGCIDPPLTCLPPKYFVWRCENCDSDEEDSEPDQAAEDRSSLEEGGRRKRTRSSLPNSPTAGARRSSRRKRE